MDDFSLLDERMANLRPFKLILREVNPTDKRSRSRKAYRATDKTIDKMERMISQHGAGGLNDKRFMRSVPELVEYTSDITDVPIESGWRAKRFAFEFDIKTKERSYVEGEPDTIYTYILEGYTDRAEVDHRGVLDPETVFYVNSVLELKQIDLNGPARMVAAYNVLHSPGGDVSFKNDQDFVDNVNLYSLRPEDINISIGVAEQDESVMFSSNRLEDHVTSDISNNPFATAAKTLRAGLTAKEVSGVSDDIYDIGLTASAYVTERSLLLNPFFEALNKGEIDTRASFTFREAVEILPMLKRNYDKVVHVFNIGKLAQRGERVFDGTSTRVLKPEARIAEKFVDLMIEHYSKFKIETLVFKATNMTQTGDVIVKPMMDRATLRINVENPAAFVQLFINAIQDIAFPVMSKDNDIDLDLTVNITPVMTNIKVKLYNRPVESYNITMFTTSLTGSDIGDERDLGLVTGTLKGLMNEIY